MSALAMGFPGAVTVSRAQYIQRPELASLAANLTSTGARVLATLDGHAINAFSVTDTCEFVIDAYTDPSRRTNVNIMLGGRMEAMSVTWSGRELSFRSTTPMESYLSGGYGPTVKRNDRYGFSSAVRADPANFVSLFNQMAESCGRAP